MDQGIGEGEPLGDIDPLKKVPVETQKRAKKGSLLRV